MTDIFNVLDTTDIKAPLGLTKKTIEKNILELFKLADRLLSVDELTVGYYRKYGKPFKTKAQIMNKVYKMSQNHIYGIESVKGRKGVYKLKGNNQ